MMNTPTATYRLQFHSKFTFDDAISMIDYITELGISDVYASPILRSKKDSIHGYDVIDASQIDLQLGGKESFERIIQKIKNNGLGWIQDIVPNHMAFDSENRLLMDIFEKGPLSKYYQYFDIQWDHPYEHLKNKVLAPFLGDLYGTCLDNNEIKINFDEEGFNVLFYEWKFPLRIDCYSKIIGTNLLSLEQKIPRDNNDYIQLLESINGLKNVADLADVDERYNQIALLKAHLWKLYSTNSIIKEYIDSVISSFNGTAGDPHSFDRLDELLSLQYFRLSFWKVGNEELNYRRFFTINSLISLRMENKDAFEYTHEFILKLVKAGDITGVRIDHIDGLYNPLDYLNQLRNRHKDLYIVVEKILDIHESLPSHMPVQGTTGYDFMNAVNGVFIDQQNDKAFDRIYKSFTGVEVSCRTIVREKKKHFMGKYMAGDIDNLALSLKQILNRNRYGKDMTMYALRRAIVEIMAQFPVYRAYMCEQETGLSDKIHIKEALALAQNTNPALVHEISFIGNILLLDLGTEINQADKQEYFHFAKKFQQFSGALMAKGAEDTTFYIYNRFISLNEVGSDPSLFGLSLDDFHEFMSKRQKLWPQTINATSTHDTKRGEDVRARLNVLSQIPRDWEKHIRFWNKINKNKRTLIPSLKLRAPARNDEYFIYQTLIGTYPLEEADRKEYIERIKTYIIKVVREGQIYTTWTNPNPDYEEACISFIEKLLNFDEKNDFLESFLSFQRKIASRGVLNSLSQTLIKLTAPGVPDFYQGTELWDLSLVDPDNRRLVDYQRRISFLNEIKSRQDREGFIKELLEHSEDGRIKLFLVFKGLKARREFKEVFLNGEYLPLQVKGKGEKQIIAFARKSDGTWVITIVSRFLNNIQEDPWNETFLLLPSDAPKQWKNVFTGKFIDLEAETQVSVSQLFTEIPAALLVSCS